MLTNKHEAVALGRTVYFDGLPCKRGHISTRYLSNDACLQCTRAAVHWQELVFPVGTDHAYMHYVLYEKVAPMLREWIDEARVAVRELQGQAQTTMAEVQAARVAARMCKSAHRAAIRSGEIVIAMLPNAPHTKDWFYDNGWKPENIISAGYGQWIYSRTGKPVTD